MYQDDNSDVGPRGTFETYRAEGDALYKNSEYTKAIESYTTVRIFDCVWFIDGAQHNW